MSDALAKVKRDLGKDAVILHTRTCQRGGLLGIGTRSVFEITATADKKVMAFRKTQQRGERGAVPPKTSTQDSVAFKPVPTNLDAPAPRRHDPKSEDDTMRTLDIESKPSARVADDPDLRREVVEIRAMVRDLLRRSDRSDHPRAPAELIDTYTHLISQDVQDELAVALLDRVSENLERAGNDYWDAQGRLVQRADASPDAVETELLNVIREMLPPAAPLELKTTGRSTVVALVGPTGVGKTTTIAKLAANMKLRENKTVGLITIDSYRIAAVEQLKTYAQILKAPIVSVLTPGEMRSAVDRMSGLDLVLIDTAGRSQRDDSRVAELDAFIQEARPDQVHLVLSTTSREATIREAIDKFFPLGARRLIFTKLDEAVGFGVILNVLKTVDMRLSYLTNGQSVPDDIEIASAGRVARLIVGDLQRTPEISTPEAVGLLTKGGRK